ncbi:MAG: hypothetical protein K0Q94_6314 [Paenibacillus sp.]|nr:hypothetical protein [Paenibacillus sp.]
MMKTQAVQKFFHAYEKRINDALANPGSMDRHAMTGDYTESFIEASPEGVQVFHNDEQYAKALLPAFEEQRRIGTQSMNIVSINTIAIDDLHVSATIHWMAIYKRRKDGKEIKIDFNETYLLHWIGNTPKIFAYIAGNEQGLLKQHGLID